MAEQSIIDRYINTYIMVELIKRIRKHKGESVMSEEHSLFDLKGKVALVTGGGSGLGRQFCDVLAEFGANVVCNDLHQENADETCRIIKKYGTKTLAIEADVSKYEQVQAMFKHVGSTMGGLDILVNNAGISAPPALIDQVDIDNWHRVISVNLSGVFYCMKEGLKLMLEKKSGSIINIASIIGLVAGQVDLNRASPYAAAKAGVIGLTRQGAAEYGQYSIRVNCIAPGFHPGTSLATSSNITRTEDEIEQRKQLLASRTPLKRVGEPKEIKGLLLYLASNASSFMTGQIIAHDGGWTCW